MAAEGSGSKINPSTGHPAVPNPDAVTEAEGVRALLSDLSSKDGGWNPNDSAMRIEGYMENGVRIITYTFDALQRANPDFYPLGIGDPNRDIERLHDIDRKAVRETLDDIEKIINVRFRETKEEDMWRANIRYFKARMTDGAAGRSGGRRKPIRDIVLSKKYSEDLDIILHETQHALGISHPGANGEAGDAGGKNKNYNKDTTIMSYNAGTIGSSGLGPFDVAALQYMYGKSKMESPAAPPLTAAQLLGHRYLDSSQPLTLDLRNTDQAEGDLFINGKFIHGIVDIKNNAVKQIKIRTVGETQIKDVLADSSTNLRLALTGNDLPNRLQGGRLGDTLTPRGGLDRLTGNGNWDEFKIDGKSGFANVIMDFNPEKDRDVLTFETPISKVELRYVDGFLLEGKLHKSTEIWAKDKDGNAVASVQVLGITPRQLAESISQEPVNKNIAVHILHDAPLEIPVAEIPAPSTAHASGLPASLKRVPSPPKRNNR